MYPDVDLLPNNMVEASHQRVHEASLEILSSLREAGTPMGYAILGSALTLGRLLNADRKMNQEEESAFVSSVMDWCGAYFHQGPSH